MAYNLPVSLETAPKQVSWINDVPCLVYHGEKHPQLKAKPTNNPYNISGRHFPMPVVNPQDLKYFGELADKREWSIVNCPQRVSETTAQLYAAPFEYNGKKKKIIAHARDVAKAAGAKTVSFPKGIKLEEELAKNKFYARNYIRDSLIKMYDEAVAVSEAKEE